MIIHIVLFRLSPPGGGFPRVDHEQEVLSHIVGFPRTYNAFHFPSSRRLFVVEVWERVDKGGRGSFPSRLMGISGLLPLLKSIQQYKHISELAGKTLAVDAYVWLHRGAYGCATELATGRPTTR